MSLGGFLPVGESAVCNISPGLADLSTVGLKVLMQAGPDGSVTGRKNFQKRPSGNCDGSRQLLRLAPQQESGLFPESPQAQSTMSESRGVSMPFAETPPISLQLRRTFSLPSACSACAAFSGSYRSPMLRGYAPQQAQTVHPRVTAGQHAID